MIEIIELKKYLSLGALRILKMFSSLMLIVIYGRTLGTGFLMDGWVYSISIIGVISLLAWGSINEVTRTYIINMIHEHPKEIHKSMLAGILFFMILATLILVLLFILLLPQNIHLVISETMLNRLPETIKIFSLLLPTLFFVQISVFLSCLLNCYDRINTPEIVDVLSNLLNGLMSIMLFKDYGIYAFIIGIYAGSLFSLLVKFLIISRLNLINFTYISFYSGYKDLIGLINFAAPVFFSFALGQIYILLERYFSSELGEGAVSSIYYSSYLKNAFQGLLSGLIFTIVMPYITRKYKECCNEEFMKEVQKSFQTTYQALLTIVPLIIFASPIYLLLILGRPESANEFKDLINLTQVYAISLVFVVVFAYVGVILISIKKSYEYAIFSIISQLVCIIFIFFGINYFNIYIFPFALIIGTAFALVAIGLLNKDIKSFLIGALKKIFMTIVLVCFAIIIFKVSYFQINIDSLKFLILHSSSLMFFWTVIAYLIFYRRGAV